MDSRTVNLVLRLLQRHLPVPWSSAAAAAAVTKQGQVPGLLPRVSLSFLAPAAQAAGPKLLDSVAAPLEPGSGASDVERNQFGTFFKQPSSPFFAFDRAVVAAGVQAPSLAKPEAPVVRRSVVESPEPVWRFELGFRLKSGMYMPAHHEETGWEASSVKRKRKKKMNKHKQRKLRRRDRHRN